MLLSDGVNLVFHVGANTGQFGRSLSDAGYYGCIVLFAPMSPVREEFLEFGNKDPFWEVVRQAAIGSEECEIKLHIAGNSVSRSMLGMLNTRANAAPGSSYSGTELVPLWRLDSLATDYFLPDLVPSLKIDTRARPRTEWLDCTPQADDRIATRVVAGSIVRGTAAFL